MNKGERCGSCSSKVVCRKCPYTRKMSIFGGFIVILLLFYLPMHGIVFRRQIFKYSGSIPGWGVNASIRAVDYVFPDLNTTLIEPKDICNEKFFVLIVVTSAIKHFSRRQTIRETWGNVSEFNYPSFFKIHENFTNQYIDVEPSLLKAYSGYLNLPNKKIDTESIHHRNIPICVVFLIGVPKHDQKAKLQTRLSEEATLHNDIIQERFIDTYSNLTIKSILMLKWIQRKCLDYVRFVMKTDDDTFVSIPNLIHALLGGTVPKYEFSAPFYINKTVNTFCLRIPILNGKNLLMGSEIRNGKPIKNPTNRYYAPPHLFSGDRYPTYLSGSSYVMSIDVVPKLYEAALCLPLFHIEDVYITGICAENIGLTRIHHPLFNLEITHENCTYKSMIAQHYILEDRLLREGYNLALNLSFYCPSPTLQQILELEHIGQKCK